jgi:hypothetical protein
MLLIKYGCTLTEDNKDGTSLNVEAFSDTVGGMTTVTVAEGDLVLEAFIDPGSALIVGKIWAVHDGSPWTDMTPEGEVAPGEMMVATAPDLPYQQGSLIVFLTENQFIAANIGIMLALTGA